MRPDLFPDLAAFQRDWAAPLLRSREPAATAEERAAGAHAAGELEGLMAGFVLRRSAGLLEQRLPPRTELLLRLRMPPEQVRAYRAVLAQLTSGDPQDFARALKLTLALRLLCNDAADVAQRGPRGGGSDGSGSSEDGEGAEAAAGPQGFWAECAAGVSGAARVGASAKSAALVALLRRLRCDAPGDRVVVVSNFRRSLLRLERRLRAEQVATTLLTGSTPPARRMAIVRALNAPGAPGAPVLLLSSKAGGLGLNLIGANRLVLLDPDWNPANDAQAMARVWREGQAKEVFIYRLVLGGTVEEKICQRQQAKDDLCSVPFDGAGFGAAGVRELPRLSWEELRRVFRLEGYGGGAEPCEAAFRAPTFGPAVSPDAHEVRGATLT